MKKYLFKIKFLFSLSMLFLLCGCSIQTNIYVQNLTNQTKPVTIKYKCKSEIWIRFNHEMKYIDRIEPVKFFKRKNEEKLLVLEHKVYDSMVVVNLPPKSTTRIVETSNYRWYSNIEYVEIDSHRYTIYEFKEKLAEAKRDWLFKIE